MAGAGYKLFNTGDVLTAAQVNTYLQEQAVMRFANAAARTTALSSVLAEGMVSYLMDTDAVEVYNGSAWVSTATGDITGITTGATSGLTGGVTSGTADLKLNTTAKGGLLVGTGSGTVSELTVGSNNQVLTADSATATGLKWATVASGGGKIQQVVRATDTTTRSTTSTSYVDANISVSITPTSASNNILLIWSFSPYGDTANKQYRFQIADSSNNAISGAENLELYAGQSTFGNSTVAMGWVNAGSTSARTYKGRFYITSSGATLTISNSLQTGQLFAIEVAP